MRRIIPKYLELLTACCMIALVPYAEGKVLETVGKTYQIAETDAVDDLEKRASRIDWNRMKKMVQPEKYRPQDLSNLPRARKSGSRMVDMTYTLDADIVDTDGTVLYPKGYTFNPLDYLVFNKTIVVINGDDRGQIDWFARSKFNKQTGAMLCITAGSVTDLRKRFHRPVYYATSAILRRFSIRALPSVVSRQGSMMEVEEIALSSSTKAREAIQ